MFNLSRLARHEKLVDAMAETQGIDLAEEIMRGTLSGGDLRAAIYSCTGCANVEGCEAWLAAHADGAEGTPEFCRNAGLFKALRAV
ncbi:hypothetical protein DDZ14_03215 [Maritimibacter sp. 55A14]|uniref:DUF6455 family protein n=1 Tax=Maritimibacter sp. 55A14 TaxID=2174844 RepID=UPI000D61717C|nr:DUF6455 family protein [Maritimibacter sp. 55A14]PWE33691.1 hypothetical protein DDZ14_03215 [Maritimibacter sp. 55A14]